ncbi:hypothetical protein C8J55DRAFT_238172 [Lentinula edodes]|uniref:Uncharacterized protein n=1 Tax=Lentinula lateritia TaxID=40482 RepID=A0A9W8ZTK4_9AGAR|nr:hypothetical protein C8J55DRAFT_238172 [Lentinula edodes]
MFTVSPLCLFSLFLLLPFFLKTIAAPLLEVTDMTARGYASDGRIMIKHKDCKDPNIFFDRNIGFWPIQQVDRPGIFRGERYSGDCQRIPIAEVRFEQFAQAKVLSDLMSVVEGTSEWDYIVKAMDYLRTKESEGQLEFYSFANTKWENLLTECRPKYGEFGKKGKMPSFRDILVNGEPGDSTRSAGNSTRSAGKPAHP